MRSLLLAALLPWLSGCAGGCGEPEPASKSSSSGGGAGPGAGPSGGGGSVAIESELAPGAPRAPKQQAASAGKGVPDDGAAEYSAAGKPVAPKKQKPRLVAACRSHDPGCDDLRAALSLARQEWGARVAVEQRPAAGPSLKLFAGEQQLSERLGLPFAQDKGLETEEAYRKRLSDWLTKAVQNGDLTK